jgi:hypothetical protein
MKRFTLYLFAIVAVALVAAPSMFVASANAQKPQAKNVQLPMTALDQKVFSLQVAVKIAEEKLGEYERKHRQFSEYNEHYPDDFSGGLTLLQELNDLQFTFSEALDNVQKEQEDVQKLLTQNTDQLVVQQVVLLVPRIEQLHCHQPVVIPPVCAVPTQQNHGSKIMLAMTCPYGKR